MLIQTILGTDQLKPRLAEAWIRLRFQSPLVASLVIRDLHIKGLGSWVYTTAVTVLDAVEWARVSLHFHEFETGSLCAEIIDRFMEKQLLVNLPAGDSRLQSNFHGHLLFEREGGRAALLLHASHTILDGPGIVIVTAFGVCCQD